MKKLLSLVLAMMMLLGVVVGSAQVAKADGPKSGGTLIKREAGDPVNFNPTLQSDDNGYAIAQNMFNRLTKLDASKSPIPDAAESWDVTDNGMTITFYLKKNMHWWDGEALDAEDVKYTFDYVKEHPETYFSSSMDIVDSIEIVDPFTVTFHMNAADMSFVARLGWYGTFILPEHIFNNGQLWEDNPATKVPVGSGPFMFESYTPGQNTTLVRNPNYHDAVPYLDKIIFAIIPDDTTAAQALINGEVDTIDFIPDAMLQQMLDDPNIRCDRNFYPSPWRYIIDVENPIMKDPAVRKAFAMCIDREDISQKVTSGIMPPEWSAYPAMVTWCSNTEDLYPDVDIEGARKVLEDAGYKPDADGYYVTGIVIDCFEGQLVDMTKLVIANCEKAGIKCELVVSEYNAWKQKISATTDFCIEAQGGFMGPDPAALASRYGTGSNSNYAHYSNPEFDELCKQAAAEGDTAKRAELYRKAQKILIEDLPAINVLGYAGYEAASAKLKNLPIEGEGKWGWNEYTWTSFDD